MGPHLLLLLPGAVLALTGCSQFATAEAITPAGRASEAKAGSRQHPEAIGDVHRILRGHAGGAPPPAPPKLS